LVLPFVSHHEEARIRAEVAQLRSIRTQLTKEIARLEREEGTGASNGEKERKWRGFLRELLTAALRRLSRDDPKENSFETVEVQLRQLSRRKGSSGGDWAVMVRDWNRVGKWLNPGMAKPSSKPNL
jgi:hypothetical protein